MNKIIKSLTFGATLLVASPVLAQPQAPDPVPGAGQTILWKGPEGVLDLISLIADWMFTFLIIISVIMFIWAAYNYMMSQGNEDNIKRAHKMIFWGVIALIVGFLSRGIVFVIEELVT